MKRTLLAVDIGILVSLMLLPMQREQFFLATGKVATVMFTRPFFYLTNCRTCLVRFTPFALQTAFAAVAAAVIVNLFPRGSMNKKQKTLTVVALTVFVLIVWKSVSQPEQFISSDNGWMLITILAVVYTGLFFILADTRIGRSDPKSTKATSTKNPP